VSTIPAQYVIGINNTSGNLPTVSATWWQIMGTVSDFLHLKVRLKEKIYLYVNSTSQRCQNKIIKTVLPRAERIYQPSATCSEEEEKNHQTSQLGARPF
jgi:hypothetical protein